MIAFVLALFALFLTLVNALTMRVVKISGAREVFESVALLVPMRNEGSNALASIESALSQELCPRMLVRALNDASTDNTEELLKSLSSPTFGFINGQELPEGWKGKVFACHQLSELVDAEYLVFLDADVRLQPTAVAAAITEMKRLGWDFISPYPREIALTFTERLIQPLLQWSWMASVPLRIAEKFPNRSMTIANGQFFIVKRDAYLAIGGHSSIKNEILDDLELARALVAAKFRGGVADGSSVASCRMYSNATELINGYTKSLWRAFGGITGTILTSALFLLTGVIPFLLALNGSLLGWYTYFVLVVSRIITALKTKGVASSALLHPLASLFLLYLIALSWQRKKSGKLIWRERSVAP